MAVALLLPGVALGSVAGLTRDVSATTHHLEDGVVVAGNDWVTVNTEATFDDPVVIVGPPTIRGKAPVTARVRNVTPTSFQVRVEEWSFADGRHRKERLSWLVIDAGTYTVGGRTWIAGHADGVGHAARTVVHGVDAGPAPTVLTTVVSTADGSPVASRVGTVGADRFSVRLQEDSTADGLHGGERVDFLTVAAGDERSGTIAFRASASGAATIGTLSERAFEEPLLFAQVTDGASNPAATLRRPGALAHELVVQLAAPRRPAPPAEQLRYLMLDGATTIDSEVTTTTVTEAESTTTIESTTTVESTTTTIPTTTTTEPEPPVCPQPAADVVVEPGQDLAALAWSSPAGTTFRLAAGEHRNESVRPRDNQRFLGSVGPNCERATVLNGSRILSDWTSAGASWVATGIAPTVVRDAFRCEIDSPRCGDPQDLFVDGVVQRHVGRADEVGPGSWFFEYATRRVIMGSDPTGHVVELSEVPIAFQPTARGVEVSGMIVEKYASPPQSGAVGRWGADGWLVADNEVRLNHGNGIRLASNSVARGNHVHHNGQQGIGVKGTGSLVEGNVVTDNNYAKVLRSYSAAGIKVSGADIRVRNNCSATNDGQGIWGDVESQRLSFTDNVVFGNYGQGIMFEISNGAVIRNNVVGGNGLRTAWLYGAQIMVSTSSNAEVVGNVVEVAEGFGNGIAVIWQNRGHGTKALDNRVADNDVTYLAARGLSGLRTEDAAFAQLYARNSFVRNRYHSPAPVTKHFKGPRGTIDLATQQGTGHEIGSTIDSVVAPRTWSCSYLTGVVR